MALGLQDDVDCLVTSEEAGVEKPSPEIFEVCFRKLRLKPEEICFVGDTYEKDVSGPIGMGMQAVWFCPEGTEDPNQKEKGIACDKASSYAELRELFESRFFL